MGQSPEALRRVVEQRPDSRPLWIELARDQALRMQWQSAAEIYARVADAQSVTPEHYEMACVLLLSGDDKGYWRLCRRLDEQFGETEDAELRGLLAVTWALGASSGIDPERTAAWAEEEFARSKSKFSLRPLATAKLRAGRFEEAIADFETCIADYSAPDNNQAFPLAMAHQALGNVEKARQWFELGTHALEEARPRNPQARTSWSLRHWLEINVWQRAAKAALPLSVRRGDAKTTPAIQSTTPPKEDGQ
jgi:tetratricopeptide (TPR) repeat protein